MPLFQHWALPQSIKERSKLLKQRLPVRKRSKPRQTWSKLATKSPFLFLSRVIKLKFAVSLAVRDSQGQSKDGALLADLQHQAVFIKVKKWPGTWVTPN